MASMLARESLDPTTLFFLFCNSSGQLPFWTIEYVSMETEEEEVQRKS
jgi:hypothetical protein